MHYTKWQDKKEAFSKIFTNSKEKKYNNLMNEEYKIIIKGAEAETELKKSRFIAHVASAETEEEAQSFIADMKKAYYDARHNCYAYIIGKDADHVKYSDDGEPSQTAGLPIYNVLKESGVRNVVCVVTRYFGGTLLGAGPLSRMYVEAAALGLKASQTGYMRYGVECSVSADYSLTEKIKRYMDKEQITVVNTVYGEAVTTFIRIGIERYEKTKEDIVSLSGGKAELIRIKEAYYVDTAT